MMLIWCMKKLREQGCLFWASYFLDTCLLEEALSAMLFSALWLSLASLDKIHMFRVKAFISTRFGRTYKLIQLNEPN